MSHTNYSSHKWLRKLALLWHRFCGQTSSVSVAQQTEAQEDFLKYLYTAGGELTFGHLSKVAEELNFDNSMFVRVVGQLVLEQCITATEQLALTQKGKQVALRLIRAHRIYEQYLAEHSGYSPVEWHKRANRMEHFISDDEQERIVSLLGNPLYDPHGDPIPTHSLEMAVVKKKIITLLPNTYWRIEHVEDDNVKLFEEIAHTGLTKDSIFFFLEKNKTHFSFLYEGETFSLPLSTLQALDLTELTESEAYAEYPRTTFRLCYLQEGKEVRIVGLSPSCRGALRRRLMDLGFVRGSKVSIALQSPLHNPTGYLVRGTTIALRYDQARYVLVAPLTAN